MLDINMTKQLITVSKDLSLITQELANSLGIPAEAPVFTSPYLRQQLKCEDCGVEYKPLVYQTGYTVKAHHFHEDQDGGIYYHPKEDREHGEIGWYTILEPIGQSSIYGRSEAVNVLGIYGTCNIHHYRNELENLDEGMAVLNPFTNSLLPVCYPIAETEQFSNPTRYRFKIVDGEVLFSNV